MTQTPRSEIDEYNPEEAVKLTITSEYGRTPQHITVIIPAVITPGEMVEDYIHEYFSRCEVNGIFEAVAWLTSHGFVITDNTPNNITGHFEPQYSYTIAQYPEAALDGEYGTEVVIDNHVDEPHTENLGSLSAETAKSLA